MQPFSKEIIGCPDLARSARGKRIEFWRAVFCVMLGGGCWSLNPVHAEGFRNPPPGAFSLGRAGGRVAQIDDPSAVTQNPANVVEMEGAGFSFDPSVIYIRVSYEGTGPGAATSRTIDPWKALPNFYATLPILPNRLSVGLGVTTPYGLANEWEPNGPFHYTAPHYTELMTINANPTVSVRLTDQLTLGLGLDVMWSRIDLRQFYPWALVTGNPNSPDGEARAKADGTGVSGNGAITWKITEKQRLAVTARAPMDIDYGGRFNLNNVPPALGGGSSSSDFQSTIKFPTIIGAGYGAQVTETVRLEADAEWLEFSRFDSLPLQIQSPPPGFPTSVREAWKNTFTAGLGGDWRFAKGWILRTSYQFYESPVPDATFSPVIPDANQNVFTVGIGYHHRRHSGELAYGGIFYDDRHITNDQNPAYNGAYHFVVHLFAFSYRYSF